MHDVEKLSIISCPEDLEVYTNALRRKLQRLPANCLSRVAEILFANSFSPAGFDVEMHV